MWMVKWGPNGCEEYKTQKAAEDRMRQLMDRGAAAVSLFECVCKFQSINTHPDVVRLVCNGPVILADYANQPKGFIKSIVPTDKNEFTITAIITERLVHA